MTPKLYTRRKCATPTCDNWIETIAAGRGGRRKYCADCVKERENQHNRELYARQKDESLRRGWMVEHDPSEYPLAPGLILSTDEVKYGKAYRTLTPGTELVNTRSGERMVI